MTTLEPWFIYSSAALLPVPALTWIIRLGIVAYNKDIPVELFQANPIVNGNDMTTVMHFALLQVSVKLLLMLF